MRASVPHFKVRYTSDAAEGNVVRSVTPGDVWAPADWLSMTPPEWCFRGDAPELPGTRWRASWAAYEPVRGIAKLVYRGMDAVIAPFTRNGVVML